MADTVEGTTEVVNQVAKLDITENNSSLSPRPSMKPCDDSHNNIFGDLPSVDKKAGRVYHMSSDIFGVGSIIDRDGQHVSSGNRIVNAETEKGDETIHVESSKNIDEQVNMSNSPVEDSPDQEKKSDGNIITENGLSAEKKVKSQRRHYPDGQRSQPLW